MVCGLQKENASHNHDHFVDFSGHPSCCRFSKEHITYIKEMSSLGIPPQVLIKFLLQFN
jgi:hypothetical protein